MAHPQRLPRHALRLALGGGLLAALLAAPAAFAQGVTGSALSGQVSDPAGAPVPEANVQLRNTTNGALFNGTTDAAGKYFLDNVPSGGPFALTVQGGIFEPVTREGILLRLGQKLVLDIKLQTVMGEAVEILVNNDALDDKRRTGPSSRVNEVSINKLPLQGRNFSDLQNTDPRVSNGSFAGQNAKYNNIQIDGGANNDLFGLGTGTPGSQTGAKALSLEAIKEFTIQVAPFDVRQGNFTGGLVNAITKSGTNDFHGSVFGYYQGRALTNQNSWFTPGSGPNAGVFGNYADPNFNDFTTLQYGGTIGGPILKDKAQFFLSVDWQSKSSSFGSPFTITGASDADDLTRAGFTLGQVGRFQAALGKAGYSNPGDASPPSLKTPDRNIFAKITTSVIDNSQLEVSWNFVSASQDNLSRNTSFINTNPNSATINGGYQLSNSGYNIGNTTNTGRIKLTSSFLNGKLSNELLGGVSIIRDARNIAANVPLVLVKGAVKVNNSDPWLAAGGERFSQSNQLDQDVFQLQDNLTYAVGAHRLTVGTSNEYFHFRNLFLQAGTGAWAFNSLEDFECVTGTDTTKCPAGGASSVNYLYQRRVGLSALQDAGTAKFGVAQLGVYAQDDWSPLPNLTVTPGVRVDLPLFAAGTQNPALLANTPFALDTSKVPSGNPLFSPRIGFNWDVLGNSDTVVRGGVGLFSGRPPYVWLGNAYNNNGLSQVQVTCGSLAKGGPAAPAFSLDPTQQPSTCGSGSPAVPARQEIDYFDPNVKNPQNLKFALGVDRRLPWGITASFDFLYTKDVNGWYVTDENLKPVTDANGAQVTSGEGRVMYGTLAANGSATPNRIDTGVGGAAPLIGPAVKVTNESDGYAANFTFQAQKQFLAGYGISFGYTYSRAFDPMSLNSSQAYSLFQFVPLDGTIAQRNNRPSAFDRPHRIVITGTAQLPYDIGLAVSYSGQSGKPYSWGLNGDANADGTGANDLAYIPATAGDISLSSSTPDASGKTQWDYLNDFISSQSCLSKARGSIIQRGACRNPWQDFLDMRLSWLSPKLTGEQRIEVQWDIFNVLNLVNPRWGHLNEVTGNESLNLLSVTGYDAAKNRPVYSFKTPALITGTSFSPTSSRWRMQLGARYVF